MKKPPFGGFFQRNPSCRTGEIVCGGEIPLRGVWTDFITSAASNKVPGHPPQIFDLVGGSGSYFTVREANDFTKGVSI